MSHSLFLSRSCHDIIASDEDEDEEREDEERGASFTAFTSGRGRIHTYIPTFMYISNTYVVVWLICFPVLVCADTAARPPRHLSPRSRHGHVQALDAYRRLDSEYQVAACCGDALLALC